MSDISRRAPASSRKPRWRAFKPIVWIAGVVGFVVLAFVVYAILNGGGPIDDAAPDTTLATGPALAATDVNLVLRLDQGVVIEFVEIQPGEFEMGPTKGRDEEEPKRRVRISRGFQLGKYEVTQEQWQEVMGSNPSTFKGARRPVEMVSWDDAQAFLGKLNARNDGFLYRLPTEAEWEYAARAGTIGDDAENPADMALYLRRLGIGTSSVGEVGPPNGWGLYDMNGNVGEWVQDWYAADRDATRQDPDLDSARPASGSDRIYRGGCRGTLGLNCRSDFRDWSPPDCHSLDLGFRLLREPK